MFSELVSHTDRLMQKKHNSSVLANTQELRLFLNQPITVVPSEATRVAHLTQFTGDTHTMLIGAVSNTLTSFWI